MITTPTHKVGGSPNYALKKIVAYSALTIAGCIIIALLIVHQIWTEMGLHVPGEPNTPVDFTAPVDSIFYIRNAQLGFRWNANTPTSIWFHPLLSWSINRLPTSIPHNYRLWLISLAAAFGSLIVVFYYVQEISPLSLKPRLIFLIPLLPGGIGMITGNAEWLCLFFTSLLAFSVIRKWSTWHPLVWGSLAILTKPNALYMIPALGVYGLYALWAKDRKLLLNSLAGIFSITVVWIVWIVFVDFMAGDFGAYWQARRIATVPLTAGPLSFLERTIKIMAYSRDVGEHLKFTTALIIPILDMWLLMIVPLKNEVERYAILAALLTMVLTTVVLNNPNKIIVYVTTFPGHIAIGLLFIKYTLGSLQNDNLLKNVVRSFLGIGYLLLCLLLAAFFVIGTPLGWYY